MTAIKAAKTIDRFINYLVEINNITCPLKWQAINKKIK